MTQSLNEVEALAKKAARGVGYPWGLAEEAAKATRWLCARSVNGCAELADLLVAFDGCELLDRSPTLGDVWTANGGLLCPIVTGAALSDHADVLATTQVQLGTVVRPMLLAPFAALAAQHLQKTVTLSWDETVVTTDGDGLCMTGGSGSRSVVIVTTDTAMGQTKPRASRANPRPDQSAILEQFAHRTYAPATEESRLKGAGAGLSDND